MEITVAKIGRWIKNPGFISLLFSINHSPSYNL